MKHPIQPLIKDKHDVLRFKKKDKNTEQELLSSFLSSFL